MPVSSLGHNRFGVRLVVRHELRSGGSLWQEVPSRAGFSAEIVPLSDGRTVWGPWKGNVS